MKITEITELTDAITQPLGRDEYIDHQRMYFDHSPSVYQIHGLELKKYSPDDTTLWYGLIDTGPKTPVLAGILKLEKIPPGWQVRLIQIQQPYKSQGYGTFLYDYAVMNDGLTLLSDFSQTQGDLGGSEGLWTKLYRQGRYRVCGYDLDRNVMVPVHDIQDINAKIYNQKENIVWMAMPKETPETIHEMLSRLQTQNPHRVFEWYGPHIQDDTN